MNSTTNINEERRENMDKTISFILQAVFIPEVRHQNNKSFALKLNNVFLNHIDNMLQ